MINCVRIDITLHFLKFVYFTITMRHYNCNSSGANITLRDVAC